MIEPTFAKEDVWAVARAVAEGWWRETECGRNAYVECKYCSCYVNIKDWSLKSLNKSAEEIRHDSDCVLLVARDLLTGAPKVCDAR